VQWWRDAVFYRVYVPSFTDSDGDGLGDLPGIGDRLGYLELLGVDALCLSPICPSPMVDHGYDVTDPRDVDRRWGSLPAFDALLTEAHAHGLRLVVDLVPHHTSEGRDWFRAALASAPGSSERARYQFRPGRGDGGAAPPNDWPSMFGGPAWTREPVPVSDDADGDDGRREWYLHLFSSAQPDLDWTHADVRADLETTLRFWLERGVDGVRIDVAHGLCPPADLPDLPGDPRLDQDAVHDVHRTIRATVDDYTGRMAVGAVAVAGPERLARYVRPDELHLAVDVVLAHAPFDADAVRKVIERCLTAVGAVGAPATWMLADHDVVRTVSRYGGGPAGLARARAMALVQLALPGPAFVYNGDELGLPDGAVPVEARRDLVWTHAEDSRDGSRVPLPWDDTLPGLGFTAGSSWLPIPDAFTALCAATQLEDTGSTLSLYRQALELRRSHAGFRGGEPEWFDGPLGCFAFRRAGTSLVCVLNASPAPVPLPAGDILLVSGPLEYGLLPPDTAAWLS
jgi:alpha-glucosidase